MTPAENEQETVEAKPKRVGGKEYLLKWACISLAVLGVLFVIENVVVEFGNDPQIARINSAPDENPNSAPLSPAEIGQTFQSLSDFLHYQEPLGFVFLGRFQDRWPASIAEGETARHRIIFDLNGTPHSYPGYEGYTLKVVRLRTSEGNEAVVVLRSVQRTWP